MLKIMNEKKTVSIDSCSLFQCRKVCSSMFEKYSRADAIKL